MQREHGETFAAAERAVGETVEWLRLGVETVGALVIAVGIVAALIPFVRDLRAGRHRAYIDLRLTLARYLAVALEFQLAADILSTAVAPTWDRIGKLAAIAVVRTLLNFFLAKEMEAEEAHLRRKAEREAGSA
jgi:uncharacterized membrane protein